MNRSSLFFSISSSISGISESISVSDMPNFCSAAVLGVEAYIVEVEVDLDYKLPSFTTVGLAEGAVYGL